MKIIKTIILLATIAVLTSVPYSIAEARDCSDPKGFHQKLMCQKLFQSFKVPKFKSSSSDTTVTSEPEGKKSGIGGIWQKIKNFGGKKVGEPG